jgi:hypothetical protein
LVNTTTNPESPESGCSINCIDIGPEYISSGYGGVCFPANEVLPGLNNTPTPQPQPSPAPQPNDNDVIQRSPNDTQITTLITVIVILALALVGVGIILTVISLRVDPNVTTRKTRNL